MNMQPGCFYDSSDPKYQHDSNDDIVSKLKLLAVYIDVATHSFLKSPNLELKKTNTWSLGLEV